MNINNKRTVSKWLNDALDSYITWVLPTRNVLTCWIGICSLAVEKSQIVAAVHVQVSVVRVWRRARRTNTQRVRTIVWETSWDTFTRANWRLLDSHRSSSCRWRSSDRWQCSRRGRGWTWRTEGRGTSGSLCLRENKRQRGGWRTRYIWNHFLATRRAAETHRHIY